jgi:ABC-type multidrug transport system fused ATPase/permease subunit
MTYLTKDIGEVSGIVYRIADLISIPLRMVISVSVILYTNYRLTIIVLILLPTIAFFGKKSEI